MKRNSILLLLCAVLLHWHSPFEFGAFAAFNDWKTFKEILVELEHKVVDEQNSAIKQESRPHLPASILQTLREELQFLMSMVNKNKLPVQLYESNDKYLELYRLVSGAISYCIELLEGTDHFGREANEEYLNGLRIRIRSIVLSLRREFGTFLLQFELNFIEKESCPKERLSMLNERLDEISTLVRHDKTYCAVAYFEGEKEKFVKLLSQNSSNTLDEKEIEQAIKKIVVGIKLNIFMQELDAKIAAFDNPCIYGRGFILFFEELQSQLAQMEIGRKTFDELQKTVLDKTNPLKQKILKQLDDLFGGFKSEIETLIKKISGFDNEIKTSELKQKLQKNKYNEISAKIRELKSVIKTLVQKLKEPFGKLLMNMQIIGLPQYSVFVIVMEMESACNAMNSIPDWNKKVFEDGIKEIQEQIDKEKMKINASYEFKASNFVQESIMGTTFGFIRPGLYELQQKLDELEKKSVKLEHKDQIEVDRERTTHSNSYKMYLKWLLFAAIMVNLVKTEDEEEEHIYLWKITHPKLTKPSYLFGILYLPWKILFRHFPSTVENIIKNVDVVVMDVNSESDEISKMALLNKELPQHILERMEKVFRIEPTDLWEVGLGELKNQQQLNSFNKNEIVSAKLEDKIVGIGKSNRKEMRFLEDCHSEVLLPNEVYEKSKIALFEQMLDVLESEKKNGTNTLKTLVESYKNGKITEKSFENHIFGLTMPPEKENELKIAKELLWAVNGANNKKWILKMNEWMKEQKPKKWIQRLNEWMMELNTENTEEKSFFFAVGLGTLITEHDSLIELLTNEGYKVEKMNNTISSDATNGEAFDDDEKDNQQPEDLNGPYFLFV